MIKFADNKMCDASKIQSFLKLFAKIHLTFTFLFMNITPKKLKSKSNCASGSHAYDIVISQTMKYKNTIHYNAVSFSIFDEHLKFVNLMLLQNVYLPLCIIKLNTASQCLHAITFLTPLILTISKKKNASWVMNMRLTFTTLPLHQE